MTYNCFLTLFVLHEPEWLMMKQFIAAILGQVSFEKEVADLMGDKPGSKKVN